MTTFMKSSLTLQKGWMWLAVAVVILPLINCGGAISGQEVPAPIASSSPAAQTTPKITDANTNLEAWQKPLDIVQSMFTITALIVGGIWTYFTFIKGRTLTPRLEPKLSLRVFKMGTQKYLSARIQLTNTGTSKVDILQEGTLLGVFSFEPGMTGVKAEDIKWERYDKASTILKDHHWIEPGETIEEPALIPLPPADLTIYKVLLRINSKKTTWIVEAIIEGSVEALKQDTGQA